MVMFHRNRGCCSDDQRCREKTGRVTLTEHEGHEVKERRRVHWMKHGSEDDDDSGEMMMMFAFSDTIQFLRVVCLKGIEQNDENRKDIRRNRTIGESVGNPVTT